MRTLSTHVLDTTAGGGRAGVVVTVHDGAGVMVGRAVTGVDGRIPALASGLGAGRHRITWDLTGGFLDAVTVTVTLDEDRHYHVPLLAAPTAATVYLGA